jgi:hypothetical protein
MPSYPQGVDLGSFVSTTNVYDLQTIYDLDVNGKDFKEFLVSLRQSITDVAHVLNIKDTGYYPNQEFVCGQGWFQSFTVAPVSKPSNIDMRPVMRKTFNCGALLNNLNKPIAHGLTIDATHPIRFTRIFGTANDIVGLRYIPLPNVSAVGPVSLSVDANNINITTTSNMTAYTITYVTLEWITEGSLTD